MSNDAKQTYVRITGTNAFGQSIEKFYSGDAKKAELEFLSSPADRGGPTSWSTEEVSELPDYVYVDCPCGKRILNPHMITKV
jgi:hypothetical protein